MHWFFHTWTEPKIIRNIKFKVTILQENSFNSKLNMINILKPRFQGKNMNITNLNISNFTLNWFWPLKSFELFWYREDFLKILSIKNFFFARKREQKFCYILYIILLSILYRSILYRIIYNKIPKFSKFLLIDQIITIKQSSLLSWWNKDLDKLELFSWVQDCVRLN